MNQSSCHISVSDNRLGTFSPQRVVYVFHNPLKVFYQKWNLIGSHENLYRAGASNRSLLGYCHVAVSINENPVIIDHSVYVVFVFSHFVLLKKISPGLTRCNPGQDAEARGIKLKNRSTVKPPAVK